MIELLKSSIDAIADKKTFRLRIIYAWRAPITSLDSTTKPTIFACLISAKNTQSQRIDRV